MERTTINTRDKLFLGISFLICFFLLSNCQTNSVPEKAIPEPPELYFASTTSNLEIIWNLQSVQPAITHYQIEKNNVVIEERYVSRRNSYITNDTSSAMYSIRACNANGCSSNSNLSTVSTSERRVRVPVLNSTLAQQLFFRANAKGDRAILLEANALPGVSYYIVRFINDNSTIQPELVVYNHPQHGGLHFVDAPLDYNTEKTYSLRICNITGCSSGQTNSITASTMPEVVTENAGDLLGVETIGDFSISLLTVVTNLLQLVDGINNEFAGTSFFSADSLNELLDFRFISSDIDLSTLFTNPDAGNAIQTSLLQAFSANYSKVFEVLSAFNSRANTSYVYLNNSQVAGGVSSFFQGTYSVLNNPFGYLKDLQGVLNLLVDKNIPGVPNVNIQETINNISRQVSNTINSSISALSSIGIGGFDSLLNFNLSSLGSQISFVDRPSQFSAGGMKFYRVKYRTTFLGKEITASGSMCIPTDPDDNIRNNTPLLLVGSPNIHLANKDSAYSYNLLVPGTAADIIALLLEVATSGVELAMLDFSTLLGFLNIDKALNLSFSEIFCMFGFTVLVPDGIGYNLSDQYLHPLLEKQSTARASVDMISAVLQFLNRPTNNQFERLTHNNQLFLAGYSKGGYVAMATAEYLSRNARGMAFLRDNNLNVSGVFVGSAPLNLQTFEEHYITNLKSHRYAPPLLRHYLFHLFVSHYYSNSILDNNILLSDILRVPAVMVRNYREELPANELSFCVPQQFSLQALERLSSSNSSRLIINISEAIQEYGLFSANTRHQYCPVVMAVASSINSSVRSNLSLYLQPDFFDVVNSPDSRASNGLMESKVAASMMHHFLKRIQETNSITQSWNSNYPVDLFYTTGDTVVDASNTTMFNINGRTNFRKIPMLDSAIYRAIVENQNQISPVLSGFTNLSPLEVSTISNTIYSIIEPHNLSVVLFIFDVLNKLNNRKNQR